jgi:hypothetical protein
MRYIEKAALALAKGHTWKRTKQCFHLSAWAPRFCKSLSIAGKARTLSDVKSSGREHAKSCDCWMCNNSVDNVIVFAKNHIAPTDILQALASRRWRFTGHVSQE